MDRVSSIARFCWCLGGAELLLKEAQRNVVSCHMRMGAVSSQPSTVSSLQRSHPPTGKTGVSTFDVLGYKLKDLAFQSAQPCKTQLFNEVLMKAGQTPRSSSRGLWFPWVLSFDSSPVNTTVTLCWSWLWESCECVRNTSSVDRRDLREGAKILHLKSTVWELVSGAVVPAYLEPLMSYAAFPALLCPRTTPHHQIRKVMLPLLFSVILHRKSMLGFQNLQIRVCMFF